MAYFLVLRIVEDVHRFLSKYIRQGRLSRRMRPSWITQRKIQRLRTRMDNVIHSMEVRYCRCSLGIDRSTNASLFRGFLGGRSRQPIMDRNRCRTQHVLARRETAKDVRWNVMTPTLFTTALLMWGLVRLHLGVVWEGEWLI